MRKGFKIFSIIILLSLFNVPKAHAENYEIQLVRGGTFKVDMVVHEDGRLDVKTSAEVIFDIPRQGIFVDLPIRYNKMDFSALTSSKKDRNKRYYFPITDFQSTSHPYALESESTKGLVYRLGERGVYLDGPQIFDYQYTIHMGDLRLSDQSQLFLINLIGDGWDFPFERVDYRVAFEKDVGQPLIRLQNSYLEEIMDFKQDGNVISGSVTQSLGKENALTILVDVEDDYFSFKAQQDPGLAAILLGVIVLVAMVSLKQALTQKHDIVDSVEFSPPDGLNSADVAYVYKGGLSSKDIISLIFYWAQQGHLVIKEHEDNQIELIKVKDLNQTSKAEVDLFNALFKERDAVYISDLENKFYKDINRALIDIPRSFSKNKARKLFQGVSFLVAFVNVSLASILIWIMGALYLHASYGMWEPALSESIITSAIGLVVLIVGLILYQEKEKGHSSLLKIIYYLLSFITPIVFYFVAGLSQYHVVFTFLSLWVLILIYYVSTASIQRTAQGSRWLGQIVGLKHFIQITEIEQLEMFVEETPDLFYDVLPYAYVLGLSDLWAKKFETIAIQEPTWYQSTSGVPFRPYTLNRSLGMMNATMSSIPASQGSSGGGFSGGGGSSGGSFGGGGFGGGGGGSW